MRCSRFLSPEFIVRISFYVNWNVLSFDPSINSKITNKLNIHFNYFYLSKPELCLPLSSPVNRIYWMIICDQVDSKYLRIINENYFGFSFSFFFLLIQNNWWVQPVNERPSCLAHAFIFILSFHCWKITAWRVCFLTLLSSGVSIKGGHTYAYLHMRSLNILLSSTYQC